MLPRRFGHTARQCQHQSRRADEESGHGVLIRRVLMKSVARVGTGDHCREEEEGRSERL